VAGLLWLLMALVLTSLNIITQIIKLPVLPCRILCSMVFNIEVGVLTFEVRLHRSLRPFVLN
jgi:hypothetical protein